MVRVGGPNPQQIRALIASDVVTVVPSGDMARKEYYDRNAISRCLYGEATINPTTYGVDLWSYTVPAGKKAMHTMFYHDMYGPITNSAGWIMAYNDLNIGETGWKTYCKLRMNYPGTPDMYDTLPAPFMLNAGDQIRGRGSNGDTVSHPFWSSALIVEFDA